MKKIMYALMMLLCFNSCAITKTAKVDTTKHYICTKAEKKVLFYEYEFKAAKWEFDKNGNKKDKKYKVILRTKTNVHQIGDVLYDKK